MPKIVLEISPSARRAWLVLPRCVRWHVVAFPDISAPAQTYVPSRSVESLTLPAMSSVPGDVAEVATRLTKAFPEMVRRVTAVALSAPILVLLECEGLHEGMWGDIIYPTRRRVSFKEQHEIMVIDGSVVSDRITLDVQAILAQLCGDSGFDPEETARMASVRRELDERARGARQSSLAVSRARHRWPRAPSPHVRGAAPRRRA
jgi:hypothetical protein